MIAETRRYTGVAIALHWVIALLILADLVIGIDFPHPAPGQLYSPKPLLPVHVTIGISVLILTLVRIAWRIGHKPPPLSPHTPRWEALAAKATHWAFYGLMLAMPLTGWLVLSAHKNSKPIDMVFKLPWPKMPGLVNLSAETLKGLHDGAVVVHGLLSQQLLLAMLALHVGAVIKHHLFDKDPILKTMLPG